MLQLFQLICRNHQKPQRELNYELSLSSLVHRMPKSCEETSEVGSSIEFDTSEEVPKCRKKSIEYPNCAANATAAKNYGINLELTISSPGCSWSVVSLLICSSREKYGWHSRIQMYREKIRWSAWNLSADQLACIMILCRVFGPEN